MVGFSGRGRWRGGGGCGGPRGGRKSASFRPSAKKMGKNNPPEPDFEQPAHSTEWSGRSASRFSRGGRPVFRRGWPGGRPAGCLEKTGWPTGFFGRPSRIWAVGRPDLGGRPAGFGGPAGRFWGVGWPGRPGGQPLTTYGSTTTYRAPVPRDNPNPVTLTLTLSGIA